MGEPVASHGPIQEICALSFIDERRGVALGAHVMEGMHGPFVLATADGGESWERFEIPGPCSCYAVPRSVDLLDGGRIVARIASLHPFGFELSKAAPVETWVSDDGGRTWTLRGARVDEGPEAERGPVREQHVYRAGTAWRLRQDGPGRPYVIARWDRDADGWQPLASVPSQLVPPAQSR